MDPSHNSMLAGEWQVLPESNEMANISINLSDDLQQFVNSQVEAGQYDGVSSYIESLVARAKRGKEKIESLLIEGLESGEPIPLDREEWNRIRRDVRERLSDGR